METSLNKSRINWHAVRYYSFLRPATGRIWLDVVYLLVLFAIQQAFCTHPWLGVIPVDIITPWLVTVAVLQPLPTALGLTGLGALLLETSTTAPAGLYLCSFFLIVVGIHLARPLLSWRHRVSWVVVQATSTVWIIAFEAFVLAITRSADVMGFSYCMSQLLRLVLSTLIGAGYSRLWLRWQQVEEEGAR